MSNKHGEFAWYELMTSDVDAAAGFYGAVVGWASQPAKQSPVPGYTILSADGEDIAGLMKIPAEAAEGGVTPVWLGYIAVDDIDAGVARIVADGGTEQMPVIDIPGVGRLAFVADPQGIPFYVIQGVPEMTSSSFRPRQAGHVNWNELATTDQAAALRFYCSHFGWEQGDAMPMGELGDYRFINFQGDMLGAVMNRMPGAPAKWQFFFGVPDIDIAARTITERGGTIHFGPDEVPGGMFVIVASDPQGAAFGLVGSRKQ